MGLGWHSLAGHRGKTKYTYTYLSLSLFLSLDRFGVCRIVDLMGLRAEELGFGTQGFGVLVCLPGLGVQHLNV